MYYPEGMKAQLSPVQWSKSYSILSPTQDSNPGDRYQNHKRWPLHYHCTLCYVSRWPHRLQILSGCRNWAAVFRLRLRRVLLLLDRRMQPESARAGIVRTMQLTPTRPIQLQVFHPVSPVQWDCRSVVTSVIPTPIPAVSTCPARRSSTRSATGCLASRPTPTQPTTLQGKVITNVYYRYISYQ